MDDVRAGSTTILQAQDKETSREEEWSWPTNSPAKETWSNPKSQTSHLSKSMESREHLKQLRHLGNGGISSFTTKSYHGSIAKMCYSTGKKHGSLQCSCTSRWRMLNHLMTVYRSSLCNRSRNFAVLKITQQFLNIYVRPNETRSAINSDGYYNRGIAAMYIFVLVRSLSPSSRRKLKK